MWSYRVKTPLPVFSRVNRDSNYFSLLEAFVINRPFTDSSTGMFVPKDSTRPTYALVYICRETPRCPFIGVKEHIATLYQVVRFSRRPKRLVWTTLCWQLDWDPVDFVAWLWLLQWRNTGGNLSIVSCLPSGIALFVLVVDVLLLKQNHAVCSHVDLSNLEKLEVGHSDDRENRSISIRLVNFLLTSRDVGLEMMWCQTKISAGRSWISQLANYVACVCVYERERLVYLV